MRHSVAKADHAADHGRSKTQRRTLSATFAPHDLRGTCRTQLSALGVPELIAELILAHEIHSAIAKSYAHHSFEKGGL
jgi:integrase